MMLFKKKKKKLIKVFFAHFSLLRAKEWGKKQNKTPQVLTQIGDRLVKYKTKDL